MAIIPIQRRANTIRLLERVNTAENNDNERSIVQTIERFFVDSGIAGR